MRKGSREFVGWLLFAALIVAALWLGVSWGFEIKKEVDACEARVCRVGAARIVDAECICVIVPEGAPR